MYYFSKQVRHLKLATGSLPRPRGQSEECIPLDATFTNVGSDKVPAMQRHRGIMKLAGQGNAGQDGGREVRRFDGCAYGMGRAR